MSLQPQSQNENNFKNCISILAFVNYWNWLDALPPLITVSLIRLIILPVDDKCSDVIIVQDFDLCHSLNIFP